VRLLRFHLSIKRQNHRPKRKSRPIFCGADVRYTYTNKRLTGINTDTTAYTLSYDAFGNMTQVKAGDKILASYTYAAGNGKLRQTARI